MSAKNGFTAASTSGAWRNHSRCTPIRRIRTTSIAPAPSERASPCLRNSPASSCLPAPLALDANTVSRDEALKFLDELSRKFSANQGEGLAFLAESSTSPSRARLQKLIAGKFPKSQWFTYDVIDSGIQIGRASCRER